MKQFTYQEKSSSNKCLKMYIHRFKNEKNIIDIRHSYAYGAGYTNANQQQDFSELINNTKENNIDTQVVKTVKFLAVI